MTRRPLLAALAHATATTATRAALWPLTTFLALVRTVDDALDTDQENTDDAQL